MSRTESLAFLKERFPGHELEESFRPDLCRRDHGYFAAVLRPGGMGSYEQADPRSTEAALGFSRKSGDQALERLVKKIERETKNPTLPRPGPTVTKVTL